MNIPNKDGSLTIDNASVQRLLDYGLLHYTDEGFYIGPWPGTNRPSASGMELINREKLIDALVKEINDPRHAMNPNLRAGLRVALIIVQKAK